LDEGATYCLTPLLMALCYFTQSFGVRRQEKGYFVKYICQ
jgi:hypothetical protein